MSSFKTEDLTPPGQHGGDDDVVPLEPTMAVELPGSAAPRLAPAVDVVAGTAASLSTEIQSMRRGRLASAAVMLVLLYLLLFISRWSLYEGSAGQIVLWTGLRLVLAVAVAGLCFSRVALSPGQVRGLEYGLFGGMTALLVLSQALAISHFLQQGDMLHTLVTVKNGLVQLLVLMILYGMYIPNNARTAARVVLTMTLAPLLVLVYLNERADTGPQLAQFMSIEGAGFNAGMTLVGAVLAIYGAHVLNGLRAELHEARKYGQYQLRNKLGTGGMGEVYLAEHDLLKRPCALKLIRPDANTDPIVMARFEREVQSAARLTHPNTIDIYDYGHTEDGTFYYVMEYLPGMSLAELIQKHGPLPPGRLIYILRQVCGGLAEAHGLGLIHRDLKPANIFITQRGGECDVAKVLDFGLVKLTQDPGAISLTTSQTVSGTPTFMSPEQATAERDLDARSDLYALGAIAYYALTGRPPFEGDSPMAIMIAHTRDPVVPPSQIRPGIPADLEAIILRCLAKKAEDRFPDARALNRALAACDAADEWDADRAEQWWTAEAGAGALQPTS